MIVSSAYSGDNNELLKNVQHEAYSKNVLLIFTTARSALIRNESLARANLLLIDKLRSIDRIDHRVLQNAHDILAATYRYECQKNGETCDLPDQEKRLFYLSNWNAWYEGQVSLITSLKPQYVRAVLESVVFVNSIMGTFAEEEACRTLVNFYNLREWADQDGYANSYPNLSE